MDLISESNVKIEYIVYGIFRFLQCTILPLLTVGPLIIESLWAKKRVSTGALKARDDPVVVQTKI